MSVPGHEIQLTKERFQELMKVFACLEFFINTVYLTYCQNRITSGHQLTLSIALTFAPCCNKSSTTARCPYHAARWRGVKLNCKIKKKIVGQRSNTDQFIIRTDTFKRKIKLATSSVWSTSLPLSRSNLTTSHRPLIAASCRVLLDNCKNRTFFSTLLVRHLQ